MREKVIEAIEKEKIVVIVRGVESKKLIPLAKAMYDGGIRLLEITYSANGSVSDEETAKNIEILSKEFEGKMYIGAGTVLTKKQVELTKNAGGKFIISPDTNKEVIEKTVELGLVSMPGALTPSEIQSAHIYGADFVKLFPVSNFGIGYVKAVKAPLSHIKMLAVGGVDENNMTDYLKAGISGFGIGTNIVNKKLVDEEKFDEITLLAKKYVSNLK
ncbi:MAG: bifunctional 4-hydroxy-2-oxoglutarate aldolase/2-dehydro-3-deoxy-phosphogluconate aldolase [Ruminococcaceae bacterium]|nr:bifunctional 4-hydroxy-2-oxoglutarate aldolase/2-dehydro-3-deoxy-phosphogluconate aldolase [Oscillospiraceae bacterium]